MLRATPTPTHVAEYSLVRTVHHTDRDSKAVHHRIGVIELECGCTDSVHAPGMHLARVHTMVGGWRRTPKGEEAHARERLEVVRVLVSVAQIVRSDTNSIQQEVSREVRHLLLHLGSAGRAYVELRAVTQLRLRRIINEKVLLLCGSQTHSMQDNSGVHGS